MISLHRVSVGSRVQRLCAPADLSTTSRTDDSCFSFCIYDKSPSSKSPVCGAETLPVIYSPACLINPPHHSHGDGDSSPVGVWRLGIHIGFFMKKNSMQFGVNRFSDSPYFLYTSSTFTHLQSSEMHLKPSITSPPQNRSSSRFLKRHFICVCAVSC